MTGTDIEKTQQAAEEPMAESPKQPEGDPGAEPDKEKEKPEKKELIKLIIKDVIIAVCIALAVSFFIRPTVVKQSSMETTVMPNDYVITYKQAYTFGEPERGDIIVFKSEYGVDDQETRNLIKRIIGLPGERVTVSAGSVFIDGEELQEDYINGAYTEGNIDLMLEEGQCFVMGDNREVSVDSRDFGPVSMDSIRGKVVLRLFPIGEIRTFGGIEYE